MGVRISHPLPANETSSVLLSSCGGASRFGVNRLLDRRIDTALKTKNTALWEMAQTLPTNKQWSARILQATE